MINERGGFLSNMFVVPVGVALMVGFFFLGYFVGKYQSKQDDQAARPASLPELASQYLPKKEDLTFYRTLTEQEDRTVSVDVKPEKRDAARARPDGAGAKESAPQKAPERSVEITIDRSAAAKPRQAEPKAVARREKKEPAVAAAPASTVRYTVQIASYAEQEAAEEEMRNMKTRGYAAFVVASELPDKGTWYRVRLGSFSNKASAEKLARELRTKERLEPFVTVE